MVYRLGSIRNTNSKFYSSKKLIWSDEPIKILGIMLTPAKEQLLELNSGKVLKKIEALLGMWAQRDLSLFGKILLINTLIVSQFVYKFTVLPPIPAKYVIIYEKLITSFIWNGKPKIPMKIL